MRLPRGLAGFRIAFCALGGDGAAAGVRDPPAESPASPPAGPPAGTCGTRKDRPRGGPTTSRCVCRGVWNRDGLCAPGSKSVASPCDPGGDIAATRRDGATALTRVSAGSTALTVPRRAASATDTGEVLSALWIVLLATGCRGGDAEEPAPTAVILVVDGPPEPLAAPAMFLAVVAPSGRFPVFRDGERRLGITAAAAGVPGWRGGKTSPRAPAAVSWRDESGGRAALAPGDGGGGSSSDDPSVGQPGVSHRSCAWLLGSAASTTAAAASPSFPAVGWDGGKLSTS